MWPGFQGSYGLDKSPNFEENWHLNVGEDTDEIATRLNLDRDNVERIINRAREKLLVQREQRVHPGRDEKILTSWNALAIRGMSTAACYLGRSDFLDSAVRSLEFIRQSMWQDGRLLATCKDGKAHLNAYLDDYSFLLDAVLHLLGTRWNSEWLQFALQLAERLLDLFYDQDNGGFFFTSHDHEQLIQRRKDFMDDALPSGNGVAALALARLGHLTNEPRYLEAAARTLQSAWNMIQRMPSAHNALLFALEDACAPPMQIILRGHQDTLAEWHKKVQHHAPIRCNIYAIPSGETGLPAILRERNTTENIAAFVCQGFTCLEPFHDMNEMVRYLQSMKAV